MTNLRVKQIKAKLNGLFASHVNTSDLASTDRERGQKVLTRCLAAFAVYLEAGCSEQMAAEAVWDGPDDNGIDAAFHDVSESRVIVVQSKWMHAGAGEPEAKEIGAFANGVKDLVEQESGNFGGRLQAKLADIGQAIMTPGTTVQIILISTGSSQIAKHGTIALDRVVDELNGSDDAEILAKKRIIGLNEIYPALASNASQERISIDANVLDWSFVSQPYRAYFGIVDGFSLKNGG